MMECMGGCRVFEVFVHPSVRPDYDAGRATSDAQGRRGSRPHTVHFVDSESASTQSYCMDRSKQAVLDLPLAERSSA